MSDPYETTEWMPRLFAGERPSENVIGSSPMLTNWTLHLSVNETWYLAGAVFASKKYNDGTRLTTSSVSWMDPELQYARTQNRWYRLALPAEVMT